MTFINSLYSKTITYKKLKTNLTRDPITIFPNYERCHMTILHPGKFKAKVSRYPINPANSDLFLELRY